MRLSLTVVSVFLIQSAVLAAGADLESVNVGPVGIRLGMTESELEASLPSGFDLIDAKEMVPEGMQYIEEHGKKAFIASDADPAKALGWITIENDQVSRVVRIVGKLQRGDSHDAVSLLISAFHSVFGEETPPLVIKTGSYPEGGQTFEYLEARVGMKRVVVTSMPTWLQVTEELGREDIPVTG